MAFRSFRYSDEATPGLREIRKLGEETVERLKEEIHRVMEEWEPEENPEVAYASVCEGFVLYFTVSETDSSTLILAGVERLES